MYFLHGKLQRCIIKKSTIFTFIVELIENEENEELGESYKKKHIKTGECWTSNVLRDQKLKEGEI